MYFWKLFTTLNQIKDMTQTPASLTKVKFMFMFKWETLSKHDEENIIQLHFTQFDTMSLELDKCSNLA